MFVARTPPAERVTFTTQKRPAIGAFFVFSRSLVEVATATIAPELSASLDPQGGLRGEAIVALQTKPNVDYSLFAEYCQPGGYPPR
jgi:hypothetical protein